MAADLKAKFTLTLDDKLSPGIQKLERQLERIAALVRRMAALGDIGANFRVGALTSDLKIAASAMDNLRGKAEGAERAIRRIGQMKTGSSALPAALSRTIMAASIAASAAVGGGGGRLPPIPDASFASGPQLRLTGPDSVGGIPLQFNPALMQLSALTGMAGQFRGFIGEAAGHAKSLNSHLREAGHGALGALTTGFGLFEPVREYANYENTARHIAITAGTSEDQLPKVIGGLTKQFDRLALSTGQSAERVVESANFLITTGIGRSAVDAMLPIVAQAATAYNSKIGDSVQAIFALRENMHVTDAQLPGTVSAMALAGKLGHFSFADMSAELPKIAPLAAMSGLNGPEGARWIMAALETARRSTGSSGEASTNLFDFMSHLYGGEKRGLSHTFATKGVNLGKLLSDAEKQGVSAPVAVLNKIEEMAKGKTPGNIAKLVGSLFGNIQSQQFVRAYLADRTYMRDTLDKLNGADSGTIAGDFLKASGAPLVQLNRLQEALQQIVRRFGQGFAALVPPITDALEGVIALVDKLDTNFPGMGSKALAILGGFLALTAVLGVVLPLLKAVQSGFLLVGLVGGKLVQSIAWLSRGFVTLNIAGGPILWILEAIALAAVLIYENWDTLGPLFARIWSDLKDSFGQLGSWFKEKTAEWLHPFDVFLDGLRERINEIRSYLGGGTTDGPQRQGDGRRDLDNSVDTNGKPSLGGVPGLREDLQANPWASQMSYRPGRTGAGSPVTFAPLEINVKVDGPGRVEKPRWTTLPDRGNMLGYT